MGEFNAEELLQRVKAQIMADDPDVTEEKADQAARNFIKYIVNAKSGDGCIIGIGNDITAMGMDDGREASTDPLLQNVPHGDKKKEISPETQDKLNKLLAKVDKIIPPVETVRLKLSRGKTTVFDSKMGGVPYFPKEMAYPTVREGEYAGKPLYLLAQLNFGKLPKIMGFPTEGILQFFAGCPDDFLYGADFDDPCGQNGFRVIYHENVINDVTKLYSAGDMPAFEGDDYYYPFKGEFLLTAEATENMSVTYGDFRFEGTVLSAYNSLFGTSYKTFFGNGGFYDDEEELIDALGESCDLCGTRMGGCPFFTQTDPRVKDEYSRHTVLLFQSDSEGTGNDVVEDEICWGDAGVANFFITPEDLARRNFSKVLYNWDCG